MTKEELQKMPKEDILNFIRKTLEFERGILSSLRDYGKLGFEWTDKQHYRFEMSGYEYQTGEVTIYNTALLNKFAFLGIYDYTDFLMLDFHKGSVRLFYQYFSNGDFKEEDLGGQRTVEIIYRIFEVTIFSNKHTRRRG